jgi:hypothetical protein
MQTRFIFSTARACALSWLAHSGTQALAEPEDWVCPAADKIALLVRAPGWISGDTLNYPFPNRPTFQWMRMRTLTHGPSAVCHYKVEHGGELQMWKFGVCEPLTGSWKESGPNKECAGEQASACVARCTPS